MKTLSPVAALLAAPLLLTWSLLADATKPTVLVLSPAEGTTVGGTERVKVQVFDTGGLAATAPVQVKIGAGTFAGATLSTVYTCGTSCGVYEYAWSTTTSASGPVAITVQATDATTPVPNVTVVTVNVTVANSGAKGSGSGSLVRRTNSSQLCIDCHTIQMHSAQSTSTTYSQGAWGAVCQTCHTAHGTSNIYLIRTSIVTPNSGTRSVAFQSTAPGQANFFIAGAPSYTGICETCHTQTKYHRNNATGDHTHHATEACTGCHVHAKGFSGSGGESSGGSNCSGCHKTIWDGMTGAVTKVTKHTLGAAAGTNDSFSDSGITWTSPLAANAAAARSCVNMCHKDHVHNNVGGGLHAYNAHTDASSSTGRAVGRGTGGIIISGTPASTDFTSTAPNGGLCLTCHVNPVESGTSPAHPAVSQVAFTGSAHNYTTFGTYGAWQYAIHDGSSFDRNCTKCHADPADARPVASGTSFGAVHYSSNPSLLAGTTNPNGVPATFICYACHGGGGNGTNLSGKPIDAEFAAAKTSKHPVEADAVHSSTAEATVAYAAAGNIFKTSRHVNCLDCHNTHAAKSGAHAYSTTATSTRNAATGPLAGVSGVALVSSVAPLAGTTGNFAIPMAASYTWIPAATGAAFEYQICLKCHSTFAWGTGAPPSGQSANGTATAPAETDGAQEFNPNNKSGHPVVAGLDSYPNSLAVNTTVHSKGLTASDMLAPWATNLGTQTMMCSDCHNADAASPAAQGPHGSALSFMTRGTKTGWPTATASAAGFATTMCSDCHTNAPIHTKEGEHQTNCYRCHIVIPHGGKMSRLIGDRGDDVVAGYAHTMPARYAYNNDKTTLYIRSFTKNARSSYSQGNCQTSCSSEHSSAATENW